MKRSRRRRASRARRWLETFLLLAGLAGIGIWVWSKVSQTLYQHWSDHTFEQQIHNEHASAERPAPAGRDGLVGLLAIPRLHLRAMVREGTGEDTLRVALGHIEGTALPGQGGNVGVAGHRDTLFRALRKIARDDVIQFQTLAGSYVYQVDDTEIVDPQKVDVLKAGQHPQLTLVTCYPFNYVGSAPERFIVKARQVSTSATPPPKALAAARSVPKRGTSEPRDVTRMVIFEVSEGHSRELAPGISFGLSSADAAGRLVNGWMWLMPDRRTIWLRNQNMNKPIVFYSGSDGRRRELRITNVSKDVVNGYLLLFHERPAGTAAPASSGGE